MKRMMGVAAVMSLSACIVVPARTVYREPPPSYSPPPPTYQSPSYQPPPAYEPAPPPVSSYSEPDDAEYWAVDYDPQVGAPPPVAVRWAPPPMRWEPPPPSPWIGAVWVGGYWHWNDYDGWVWARGHWMMPPQPRYTWVEPYYENRDGLVIYVAGHWDPPGVVFIPPPRHIYVRVVEARPGYHGYRCDGPNGVFIPPPPG